jgi:hypothetical protein
MAGEEVESGTTNICPTINDQSQILSRAEAPVLFVQEDLADDRDVAGSVPKKERVRVALQSQFADPGPGWRPPRRTRRMESHGEISLDCRHHT